MHNLQSDESINLATQQQDKTEKRTIGWQPFLSVIPFLVMLSLCWRGIDFGVYWDEDYDKITAVAYSDQ